MKRLTEKQETGDYSLIKYNSIVRANARFKLGQYEDVEEELGIDLVILFKALKNGIIYKTDYGWDKEDYHWNYIDAKYISLGMSYYEPFLEIKLEQEPNVEHLELSNYGKTWALTKEEFKNE